MKHTAATLVLSCLLGALAWAGPVEDGVKAYEKEDYKKALQLLQSASPLKDPRALTYLGNMHYYGLGTPLNTGKGMPFYRQAVAQNYGPAEENLGLFYKLGQGVKKDLPRSVAWYKRAAFHGERGAFQNLGGAYRFGEGVPADMSEAYFWEILFRRAIDDEVARLEKLKARTPEQETQYMSSLQLRAQLNNGIIPFPPKELSAEQRAAVEARARAYKPRPGAPVPKDLAAATRL